MLQSGEESMMDEWAKRSSCSLPFYSLPSLPSLFLPPLLILQTFFAKNVLFSVFFLSPLISFSLLYLSVWISGFVFPLSFFPFSHPPPNTSLSSTFFPSVLFFLLLSWVLFTPPLFAATPGAISKRLFYINHHECKESVQLLLKNIHIYQIQG